MNPHKIAADKIVRMLINEIKQKDGRYIISLAGESGSGKTETGKALVEELEKQGVVAMEIGQDNYFNLPPSANDAMRKADHTWLGPRIEVNLNLLNKNIKDAVTGSRKISIPYIEYDTDEKELLEVDLSDIKVIIVEGTYVTLLKNVDSRIFIDANYVDTLPYRKQRNRGNEVNDPFVEGILETEHKIIAGHIFLADIVITKDYEVVAGE